MPLWSVGWVMVSVYTVHVCVCLWRGVPFSKPNSSELLAMGARTRLASPGQKEGGWDVSRLG